jgi:hypothetical protein
MFASLEAAAIKLIKHKFSIKTEIIDTDTELSLCVYSVYDGITVHSHTQDLLPLLDSFRKRLHKPWTHAAQPRHRPPL